MIKRIKDKTGLVKFGVFNVCGKHYYQLYLWAQISDLFKNTVDNPPGTVACCCFAPSYVECYENGECSGELIAPKLGELHFVVGKFDDEIIVHEVCHAVLHRMRFLTPTAQQVMEQIGDAEETICYQMGFVFIAVKKWLMGG